MTPPSPKTIEFTSHLMRDGQTYAVRYVCDCGCRPQVRLRQGSPAGHEHCCCGIVHAAGPDARGHLDAYLAERRAAGQDADITYGVGETQVGDPWGASVPVVYAVPIR